MNRLRATRRIDLLDPALSHSGRAAAGRAGAATKPRQSDGPCGRRGDSRGGALSSALTCAVSCAISGALSGALAAPLAAQGLVEHNPDAAPVYRALRDASEDVRTFNEHVVTLANPFFEGRVPGSPGMVVARNYMEWYLRRAGMEPAFDDFSSFRQPFPLGSRTEVVEQALAVDGKALHPDTDFTVLGLSADGEAEGNAVFCGYGIDEGVGDYTSFPEDEQLEGKIAIVFRFEPMDGEGKSQWARRAPWTRDGNFQNKIRAVQQRGARAIVFVNPPGCADPRALSLVEKGEGGRNPGYTIPVLMLSNAAAERLLAPIAGGRMLDLRHKVDATGVAPIDLGVTLTLKAGLKTTGLEAENVGGILRGRGALADQWIVIGGHLDHLGIGRYGARDRNRVGEIHPGADDNATGVAAVLMLAESLRKAYDALPAGAAARSILFIGFDAEEAGLHGARYYTREPIAPLTDHSLMINFDMIGRIVNRRLSVSGVGSAEGMEEWLQPIFDASPLDVVQQRGMGIAGSDHAAFYMSKVPVLFGIIADFHDDYHTPADVSWKINREDGVHTVHLFHEIAAKAATHPDRFEFSSGR